MTRPGCGDRGLVPGAPRLFAVTAIVDAAWSHVIKYGLSRLEVSRMEPGFGARLAGESQRKDPSQLVSDFEVPPDQAKGSSNLFKLFMSHEGRLIHKWDHYLDLYDRHFAAIQSPRMLEIGVFKGGSLELWRKYFGANAVIFGVDIDPTCEGENVRIGSQDDPQFLLSVVQEMGGLDIVLDDGSHVGKHQEISFRTLFPLLRDGGIYAIEDLHTAYWPNYDGGHRRAGTGIELVKSLIDDMHHWWHSEPALEIAIGGIHIYDSIAFIEKRAPEQPRVTKVGRNPAAS